LDATVFGIEVEGEGIQEFKITGTPRPGQIVASALDLPTGLTKEQVQLWMKDPMCRPHRYE
jgi:hypothetical protein